MSLATRISDLATRVASEIMLRGTPVGGATGQVLAKVSGTDLDTEWADPAGGGSGGISDDVSQVITLGTDSLPFLSTAALGILAGYVGEWNSSPTYEIGQSVTRRGYLYRSLVSNFSTDPAVSDFAVGAAQSIGIYPLGSGETASGAVAGLAGTPTTTITVDTIRYYGSFDQAQTFRVGIASAIGATPAGIVWLAFVDGAPLKAGMNVVNLPSSVILTGGVTYYWLVQTFNGGDAVKLMCSGSSGGSGINLSSMSRRLADSSGSSWDTYGAYIPAMEVGYTGLMWLQVAATSNSHTLTVDGTAAPTSGAWLAGDKINNTAPAAGGFTGWVCVTGGSPGTWKGFGLIEA